MSRMFSQHVIKHQLRKENQTDYGVDIIPVGKPEDFTCSVRAISAKELNTDGLTALNVRRIQSRKKPGDRFSFWTFDGDDWESQSDPLHFDGSARTDHWWVLVKRVPKNG